MEVIINGEEYRKKKCAKQSDNDKNGLIRKLQFQLMGVRGFPDLSYLRKLDVVELISLFGNVLENKAYENRLQVMREELKRLKNTAQDDEEQLH